MSQLKILRGRPAKVIDPHILAEIRSNPENLSNKELCKKYNLSTPTLLKIRYRRGIYGEVLN